MIDVKILKRLKQGNLISSSGGFATAGTATVMPTDCLQKLTRVLVPVDVDQNELTWDAPLDKIFAIKSVKGIYSLEFLSARGLNSAESGVTGGINDSELAQYLIDNNYAKKSDIPSLAGFATESWVKEQKYLTTHQSLANYLKSADAASTYLTQTDAADTYQPLENGKGLSANDFTDDLLAKLNGIESGANKYVHPSNGADTAITAGNGKVVSAITVNSLGHVTSVASKTLAAADIPVLPINKITNLQNSLDAKLDKTVYETFKTMFDDMFVLETVNGVKRIKALHGLYTDEFLSARGLNTDGSSAGGSFGLMRSWPSTAPSDSTTDALGANLGWALRSSVNSLTSRVATLEDKNYLDALSLTTSGSGNAVTAVSLSADKKLITVTKGTTFLTSHQSLANYYTKSEVETKLSGYLPLTGGTLTGTLRVPDIAEPSGFGLLSYHPTTWNGVSNTQWGVGAHDSQGVIRSNNTSLIHYRMGVGKTTIWDSGNDGSGSGLDADLLDGLHHYAFAKANQSPTVDLNTVNGIGMMCNTANVNATSERHYPIQEAGCLIYCTAAYSSANQIYGSYNSNRWFARGGAGWDTDHPKTNWREFAFTDSNVASATKLQTARTLWGQSFDGTGNVNGLLTINYTGETGLALYRKEAGSGAFMRFYNANQTANYFRVGYYGGGYFGISYNSGLNAIAVLTNGNVGIGHESPAYRLDVNGVIRANNEIISTSANAFRMVYGNYGAFFRNDGNYTYLLLTASGNQYGSYNSLRPFYVNNSSGLVTMGNGLSVNKITIGSCTITYENGGLHFSSGIYSDGFVSAKGVNSSGSGGGTGVSYNRLDNWTDYASSKEGYVLSAKLGYDLYSNKLNATKSAIEGLLTGNISSHTHTVLNSIGRTTAITDKSSIVPGISMVEAYSNGYPCAYGNVIRVRGLYTSGSGELLLGWSGTNNAVERIYYRNNRDAVTTFSEWRALAFTTDIPSLANYVTLNTTQTISGMKTFTAYTKYENLLMFKASSATKGIYLSPLESGALNFSTHENYGWKSTFGSIDLNGNLKMQAFIKDGGTATQALMADGSVRVVNILSSVTNLGWSGTSGQLATINTLAYWNGQYASGSSNLQYCDRGRFGTIVTAASGDYVTALGTNGNSLTWTKNGAANNLTVPYATKSRFLEEATGLARGNNDSSIELPSSLPAGLRVRFKNATGAGSSFVWNTIVDLTAYSGASSSGAGYRNQFLFVNSGNYSDGSFWVRNGVDSTWNAWRKVLTDGNYTSVVTTLRDRTNGTATYLNYGASGLTSTSWFAAWNGYELRAISPANVLTTINALSRNGGSMANTNVVTNLNADLLDGVHLSDIRSVGYAMQDTIIDASSLDSDTWYPVIIYIGARNNTRIEVLVALDSGVVPPWSTHSSGFSVRVIWEVNGYGWGTNSINRTIYAADSQFASLNPVRGIGQLTNSSNEYVYVRGGGKYRFRTSNGIIPSLKTTTYTTQNQSVSPTTTAPTVISRDNARITDNVASATKLQTARTLWGKSFDGTGNVSGDMTGVGTIYCQGTASSYREGLRIKPYSSWSTILLGGNDLTADSGTSAKSWAILNNDGNFYINKNGSSTQQAPRLWGHANGWTVGNTSTASYALNTASFICDSWVRTKNATGWYNETYGGGWYMTDTTWIRNYNNKSLYMSTATIRTDYLFDRQGYGGASWNNGYGAYNTAITDNTAQTPLMVAYRAGQTPNVTGANRLFAMELLNSGKNLHLAFGGTSKFDFTSSGSLTLSSNIYCVSVYPTNMVRFYRESGNSHYLEMNTSSDRLLFCQMTNNTFVEARAWISWDGVFYAKTGIYSNGYVSARGQNTSDVRLKDQIKDFRATEILKALHPKAFKWNTVARHKFKVFDTDDVQYGLIAQEAKGVAPWLVAERLFDDDYLSIHYHKLIPVLHKGFIEHEDEITRLRRRVAELEKEVEQLKTA